MGIRLVMEATGRHAPGELTWRERFALAVLASSAMDATRECPPGIESNPEIIARLRLGRSERFAVLDSLVAKGALLRIERGRNGVKAVYAIAPFGINPGSERPGDPDAPNGDDGTLKHPGFPDPSAGAKGPGSANEGSGFHPLKGPGFPDPAPYKGVREFKTGGKTPLPPAGSRPLFPFALPDVPPEEGDLPEGEKPAPNEDDRQALAAEIRKSRPEWSARSILRALEKPTVAERPWPLAREAMRLVAADPASQHPGRLEHDGPWWADAARTVRGAAEPADSAAHAFDPDPETRLCCACRGHEVDKNHSRRRTA